MRRAMEVKLIGGRWWVKVIPDSDGLSLPLPNGKFYHICETEQEANDFAADNLIYTLPKRVECACGAGCTDGVCTAQELGE